MEMIGNYDVLKLYDLVKKVCDPEASKQETRPPKHPAKSGGEDNLSNESLHYANEILKMIGTGKDTGIYEIPLCWDEQVCIRFYLKDDWPKLKNGKRNLKKPPDRLYDLYAYRSAADHSVFCLELKVENSFGDEMTLMKFDFKIYDEFLQ